MKWYFASSSTCVGLLRYGCGVAAEGVGVLSEYTTHEMLIAAGPRVGSCGEHASVEKIQHEFLAHWQTRPGRHTDSGALCERPESESRTSSREHESTMSQGPHIWDSGCRGNDPGVWRRPGWISSVCCLFLSADSKAWSPRNPGLLPSDGLEFLSC